jgi:polysaccharide export outer membrane protein
MNAAPTPRNYASASMRPTSRFARPLLALLLALGLAPGPTGCRDNPPVVYPTVAPLDETKLTLGPGDKLELVIFFGARESKATYTLDASGQMDVQYIGAVHAGGKVVGDVKAEIVNRLKDGYINDPIVSLTVVEVNSRKLSVFGQVARSGTIRFTPGMTIVEAIAQSGGFSPMARKNMVKVTRLIEGRKETYKIPVEMIGEGKRPNFPMMPGDEVFVPERAW